MRYFRWRSSIIFLFIGALFIHSKIKKSSETLAFLRDASYDFNSDTFIESSRLEEILEHVRSPAVLLLNKVCAIESINQLDFSMHLK
jgi:uncharacterized protein YgfB (UPF0149 family)